MAQRYPSMSWLLAFEAAARHLSFKAAADELGLTASAISHRIGDLETMLGVELFTRLNRGIGVTEVGQSYVAMVRRILEQVDASTRQVRSTNRSGVLTIHSTPTFATCWLMPRLGHFIATHAKWDLKLNSSPEHANFFNDDVDVDVRYGQPIWPDLHIEPILTEEVAPLCHPRLLAPRGPLARPEDLSKVTLIYSDQNLVRWSTWLAANGVSGVALVRGPHFDRSVMSIQAAADCVGVALESTTMAESHLRSGSLVRPFPQARNIDVKGHFLVTPTHFLARPGVAALISWIRQRARESSAAETRAPV